MSQQQKQPSIALVTLHSSYSHSSLALSSIASFCRDEPFYSKISIHEALTGSKLDSLLEELVTSQPDIIGFSVYLWNVTLSIRLAIMLKKLLPKTVLVFGGPEAGPRGEELLSEYDALDYVIHGEGEAPFRDLVRFLYYQQGSLERISGLCWRQEDGTVDANLIRPEPLESLISPFTTGRYGMEKKLIYMETSRGCPFHCQFCTSSDDPPRLFPLSRIEEDLKQITKMESGVVKLLDRSFHLGKTRTLQLLKMFCETPEGLCFHLELNPDRISDEVFELFREAPAGKFQFEIGLQTLKEETLSQIQRSMNVTKGLARIRDLLELKKHHLHLDLIIGLPGETKEDCLNSLNRVFALYGDHLQLGTLKLLPGTGLRNRENELGYIRDPEPPYEILGNETLSFQDLTLFKKFAELLERLWNSDLLFHTISHLVPCYYEELVSDFFLEILTFTDEEIVQRHLQTDGLFSLVADFLLAKGWLEKDVTLRELFLWDYFKQSKSSGKTPAWFLEQIQDRGIVIEKAGKKKLPLLHLSESSCAIVNRRKLKPIQSGDYALWLKSFERGRPLELFPIIE